MKKMIQNKFRVMAAALVIALSTLTANAQNNVEVSVGADVVSNYIWRGQDCGGVSIQPSIAVGKYGFSLSAWGSVGIEKEDTKELDLTLGYNAGGFSVAVTDYWFDYGGKYFKYASKETDHVYEATVGYDFGPLSVSWNTNFAGADYYKAKSDGSMDRAYSSYAEVMVPFKLGEFDFSAEVGLTPWEGAYSDGFNVVNVGLTAGKNIKITDSFSLPAFAKITVNPNTEKAYFAFGISF
ncbi:hypothetical protein [Bacteroides sp. 224]|uniref:hypothetical protein n=1 Tax=Bacteroides sp. 224 TaxID=2302936 RepID=UPI0013D67DC6|nr:hypothetical protein [Bacteroides sp. 224]NDV64600.1 hypothetical protein [Bacteroides sp. 224]